MKLDNRIASFASVGQPAMIAVPTWTARRGADKFAEDPHSKRGKIKTATQGQFSIDDCGQSTSQITTVCVVSDIEYYLKD